MKEKFWLRAKTASDLIEVNNDAAYFPEMKNMGETYHISTYVRITNGKKAKIFESKIRTAAQSDDIILSKKNLEKLGGEQAIVTIEAVSSARYWIYSLIHDNLWTFIGFVIALAGVIIDGSLKLGETGIGIECSRGLIVFLKIASFCLGIIGTFILLIKALAKK